MDVNCVKCGKSFEAKNVLHKFCSEKCKSKYHNDKKKKGTLEPKKCKTCGKEFVPRNSIQSNCSKECSKLSNKLEWEAKRKYPNGFGFAYCLECGRKFEKTSPVNKFCDTKCRSKYYKKNKKYDTNEIYTLDIEDFVRSIIEDGLSARKNNNMGLNYRYNMINESLRDRISSRDNYCCRVCNSDTNLEIHHIVKLIDGGGNNDENLITVCKSCHRALDTLDVKHAISKCKKNFIKNCSNKKLTRKNVNHILDDSYNMISYLYDKVKDSDEIDIKDIIKTLDNVLELIEQR